MKGEVVAGLQDGEEEGDIHVDIHEEVPTAVALHKSAEYSFDLKEIRCCTVPLIADFAGVLAEGRVPDNKLCRQNGR